MPLLPDKRFLPANVCIYCGNKNNLTDEHIFPQALDGNLVLPLSSCLDCNRITSGFESRIINALRDFRSGLKMGAKRRKTSPQSGRVVIVRNGTDKEHFLPLSKHPLIIGLPIYKMPGVMRNDGPIRGIDVVNFQWVYYGNHPMNVCAELGAKTLRVKLIDGTAFAKIIAKVAYSYAVAILGMNVLDEVFPLDAILGKTDDIGHWVGTYSAQETKTPDPNTVHRIRIGLINRVQVANFPSVRLLRVNVQLFSNSPSPGYVVILGSLRDKIKLPDIFFETSELFPNRARTEKEK